MFVSPCSSHPLLPPFFPPPPPPFSLHPSPPSPPPPTPRPILPQNSCVHSAYFLSSATGHTFQPNNETFLPQYQLDSSHVVFPAVNTKESTYRTVLLSNTGTTPIMFDIAKDPSKWVVICAPLMSVELGLSVLFKHVLSCAQVSYLQAVESLVLWLAGLLENKQPDSVLCTHACSASLQLQVYYETSSFNCASSVADCVCSIFAVTGWSHNKQFNNVALCMCTIFVIAGWS